MPESGVRSVSWVDLSGGVGLYRIRGPQDMNRVYMANALTQRQGRITLPPAIYSTGSTTPIVGSDHYLGVLPTGSSNADELYAMGSDKIVYELSTFATTWTARSSALTAVPTDVCNAMVNGTYYLVFACNNTNTVWSSDGATWTDNGQNSLYVCAWNGNLWTITSEGQLSYTSDMSTFVDDALLPTGAGAVKGLVTAPDASGEDIIYALTTKGLYAHDFANRRFILTSFRETTGTYYGKPVEWGGNICMPIDDLIWVYPPSTARPYAISPVLPDGHQATADTDITATATFGPNILSIWPLAGRLFALTGPSSGAGGRIISYFDGQGWQGFGFTMLLHRRLFISYTASKHILWEASLTAGKVYYNIIPPLTKDPSEYDVTEPDMRIVFPWFDGFDPVTSKVALRAYVEATDLDSTHYISLYYATNYTVSAMQLLGRISTNGVTAVNFPANTPVGMEFRAIRFVLALFAPAADTASPRLQGLRFEWRPNPLMET